MAIKFGVVFLALVKDGLAVRNDLHSKALSASGARGSDECFASFDTNAEKELSPQELCVRCVRAASCGFCLDVYGPSCSELKVDDFGFNDDPDNFALENQTDHCRGIEVRSEKDCATAGLSNKKRQCPAGGVVLGKALGDHARVVWGETNFWQSDADGVYSEQAMKLNHLSRDWGIVPDKFANSSRVVAKPGEDLRTRLGRLDLAKALLPGDMFFVFKRDRWLYHVTATFTKASHHPLMPARIAFGHAGVVSHVKKDCPYSDYTKCVYVTEQGLKGTEFRPIHEAWTGQSEVLVLRPRYLPGMRQKVVDAADRFIDHGVYYNFTGAALATLSHVKEEDYNTVEKANKATALFCSYFALSCMSNAGFFNSDANLKLPPSMMADVLLRGDMASTAADQTILFSDEMERKFGSNSPAEVVLYQQCAEGAEGPQIKADVTYPTGWKEKVIKKGGVPESPWRTIPWAPVPEAS